MKITEVVKPKGIVETSIEGLFVRNVPIRIVKQMQEFNEDSDIVDVLDFYFEHIACDRAGDRFEDTSRAEIESMDIQTMRSIVGAVNEAVGDVGND